MAAVSYPEQRKTKLNYDSNIMEARVIANYGDPGLDEDYHFDILSHYVLVMIESVQRVPTNDKYNKMFALVKRPESLWVTAVNTPDGNPTNQKRSDAAQNVSVGLAGNYSVNGISRIYPAYTFGESIRIRKLSVALQPNDSLFYSAFTNWDSTTSSYAGWHSEGSTLPYFTDDNMKATLRTKTINPTEPGSNYYMGFLHKLQYEAFSLTMNQSSQPISKSISTIFDGSWAGNPGVYSANGGYVFAGGNVFVLLNSIGYEDVNMGNKARVATNECIPLVVTTPNSFPVPSSRSIGTIVYNPTYSTIVR